MIKKILIANRGEIALRVQRTAQKMGIRTVAIYSVADKDAPFVKQANEAVVLQGNTIAETYLNIHQIISIAQKTNADAIHPGYGFLSENTDFVAACSIAQIIFIGPNADAMKAMGNKIAARESALKSGVSVTPGITGSALDLIKNCQSIGFPLLIKAAAGGGGKGMRIVYAEAALNEALEATAREAKNYFGDDTIYIEKYIATPRHIEVQILGDQHGHIIHLYERECSLQRRHQKIVEEAPSSTISPLIRESICEAAIKLATAIGYYSAGTMEFLLDEAQHFYFLEMNTRIQVEHPITELTTGIDIVEQQILIANGQPLSFVQTDIQQEGHAIECRIYAEDPTNNFLPSPGTITYYQEPQPEADTHLSGQTIRIDGMLLQTGDIVSDNYDPMISKLITWAKTREEARHTMLLALEQYHIQGIKNNILFLKGLLRHPDFIYNKFSTKYIDNNLTQIIEFIQQEKQIKDKIIPAIAALSKSFTRSPSSFKKNIWQDIGYWRHINLIHMIVDANAVEVFQVKEDKNDIAIHTNNTKYIVRLTALYGINYLLSINNSLYPVSIFEHSPGNYQIGWDGSEFTVVRTDISNVDTLNFDIKSKVYAGKENITSPMPGKVIKINVNKGDEVKKGDLLLIVEAMKMENNIIAPSDGIIDEIFIQQGETVNTNKQLLQLKDFSQSS